MQNPFTNSAFSMTALTNAMNILPINYGRVENLNLFPSRSVRFRHITIEEQNGVLSLLPTQTPGAPATVGKRGKRKVRTFTIPHIPHDDVVLPEEVQGIRAFGSDNELKALADVITDHLQRNVFDKLLKELSENRFQQINEKDAAGYTILHRAAQVSEPEVIKLLIEKGAKTNIENNSGETPLYLAAFDGKVENVKVLLEEGADVNAIDDGGYTALHSASLMSCEKTVRELIKAGSNVNTGNYIGRTPLHSAVFMREIGNVRAILEAGGDVNARDHKGYTPIDLAYMAKTKEIIRELVAKQKVMEVD